MIRLKLQQNMGSEWFARQVGELRRHDNPLIIERCGSRRTESALFWGAYRTDDGMWNGENKLGRLWMEIFAE